MSEPVSRADADAFIGVYNRVTTRCASIPRDARGQPIGRRPSASAAAEAAAVLLFCAEHGFDPEAWVVARHAAIDWKARVPLKTLASASANFIAHFNAWGAAAANETTRTVEPIEDFDKLAPYAEALKGAYAADPRLCMVQPDARGWHPASTWCVNCSQADPCRRRLPPARRAAREAHAG